MNPGFIVRVMRNSLPATPTQRAPRPVHLPALVSFECVARHLSFVRASEELNVTNTAISKTIKQLEAQLGVRLFNRTTRSVALTEAGTKLLGTLAPALAQIRDSVQQAGDFSERPHGLLRINTSYVAYAALIQPRLASFGERYPEITLDITIDNNLSDIVAGGFDAGIRLGHALQLDMIAVPLGPMQQLTVVGSPDYFRRRGRPRTPHELLEHDCIRHRLNRARFFEWEFRVDGKDVTIDVRGRLVLDDMRAVLGAACEGSGLGLVFRQFAAAEIASGAVIAILDPFLPPDQPFHLYYANRAHTPSKLRAFIEFIQER
ncbi:LysR family transcriptional regulator [Labrys okinawensis]|uniref:LysR family transcriptional regulator n=1 Tax=Labrys okinawensis TaxID=346911 RepID=UPI0039BD7414